MINLFFIFILLNLVLKMNIVEKFYTDCLNSFPVNSLFFRYIWIQKLFFKPYN